VSGGADLSVVMEMENGRGWGAIGPPLRPSDPPASISSDAPLGREVYVFGFHEGTPGVWRSVAGLDAEVGATRVITSTALELLADLRVGPHELPVHRPSGEVTVRFSLKPGAL
jgi:hypothetical protein